MHVRAVAIYEKNERGAYVVKESIEKEDTTSLNRFGKSCLRGFLSQVKLNRTDIDNSKYNLTHHIWDDASNTHFYVQLNSGTKHILLLASMRELERNESEFLLANINYVDQESDLEDVKEGLKNIMRNPMGYRARGTRFNFFKVDSVREEIGAVTDVMKKNIELVLERGERLEELVEATDMLAESSRQFRRGAEDLKDNMTCCGGPRKVVRHAATSVGQTLRLID